MTTDNETTPETIVTEAAGTPVQEAAAKEAAPKKDRVAQLENEGDIAADYLGLPTSAARARLYRNKGDGTFDNVTIAAGVYKVLHTMGCNYGDLDNDGWLDFFLGTGVGTKAYAIIEQGRIGQIVSARPQDRRAIIEEAAGIAGCHSGGS